MSTKFELFGAKFTRRFYSYDLVASIKFEPGYALSNLNLTFPQIFAASNLNASFRRVKFKLFYDAVYPPKKLVQIIVAAVTLTPRHRKINRLARIL